MGFAKSGLMFSKRGNRQYRVVLEENSYVCRDDNNNLLLYVPLEWYNGNSFDDPLTDNSFIFK